MTIQRSKSLSILRVTTQRIKLKTVNEPRANPRGGSLTVLGYSNVLSTEAIVPEIDGTYVSRLLFGVTFTENNVLIFL